ncbi:MAG TPA: hypothetical protein VME22_12065 [Solirubrobacteraceae bacterium]|nr:hypothetical protein [Solirubrobacteraceae bacterium]
MSAHAHAPAPATPRRPAHRGRPARPTLAVLLGLESATLALFSALHLSGALRIGSGSSDGAGVAEALICLALAAGAFALARAPAPRGRRVALCAVAFAILGFIIGLTFTVQGGDAIDLMYHATMLPVLVATAVLLARRAPRG